MILVFTSLSLEFCNGIPFKEREARNLRRENWAVRRRKLEDRKEMNDLIFS